MDVVLISGGMIGAAGLIAYTFTTVAQNVAKYFLYYDQFEQEKIDRSKLRDGDHIYVPGSISDGLKMKGLVGYYHHGIYLGVIDGKQMVTDFGAVNKELPVIRELDQFLSGYSNQLYRRNYKVNSSLLSPEKSLNYARSICSGKEPWEPYSLNTNNCEHYASLLKIKQLYSAQAQHLPQEPFYRQVTVPNQGESILKLHTE